MLPQPSKNYLGKTEFMLLTRAHFVGPLQAIKLGNSRVNQIKTTRCLGVELDVHVKKLIKSFTQKLNLLRSLYFPPTACSKTGRF